MPHIGQEPVLGKVAGLYILECLGQHFLGIAPSPDFVFEVIVDHQVEDLYDKVIDTAMAVSSSTEGAFYTYEGESGGRLHQRDSKSPVIISSELIEHIRSIRKPFITQNLDRFAGNKALLA